MAIEPNRSTLPSGELNLIKKKFGLNKRPGLGGVSSLSFPTEFNCRETRQELRMSAQNADENRDDFRYLELVGCLN